MRKMATFVSASCASGEIQTEKQYLSHMISGAVGSSLIGPRCVGNIAPKITQRAGTEPVISRRFSQLVTPAAKMLLRQERAIRNETQKADVGSSAGSRDRVRKPMKKRTVVTSARRLRRTRKCTMS